MKRFIIILCLVSVFFVVNSIALASRTDFSTSQKCDIEGVIKSIEYREAFRDPCLEEGVCPVGAYNPETPAKYDLSVLIELVSCTSFDGMSTPKSYEEHFPIGEEQIIYIEEKDVLKDDSFVVGQKIAGEVEWFFGDKFISYQIKEDNNGNQKNNVQHIKEPSLDWVADCLSTDKTILLCKSQFFLMNNPFLVYAIFALLVVIVVLTTFYVLRKIINNKLTKKL